jgi:hypothetical protein
MPPQERLYRSEGIVLREMDYAEADRILTPADAQSARCRPWSSRASAATSRKVGHLGLFYRAQVMLAAATTWISSPGESLEEYEGLRGDCGAFTAPATWRTVERFARMGEESQSLLRPVGAGAALVRRRGRLRLWMRYFETRCCTWPL